MVRRKEMLSILQLSKDILLASDQSFLEEMKDVAWISLKMFTFLCLNLHYSHIILSKLLTFVNLK